jgi:hypothetical protein
VIADDSRPTSTAIAGTITAAKRSIIFDFTEDIEELEAYYSVT